MKQLRALHLKMLGEQLANLTIREAKELVRILEDDHGIVHINPYKPILEPVIIDEGPDEFDVYLKDTGQYKLGVIKSVKESMGIGLRDAKDLVDSAPCLLKSNVFAAEAELIKTNLEEAGALVDLV